MKSKGLWWIEEHHKHLVNQDQSAFMLETDKCLDLLQGRSK